jgi:uncharacterized protein (DUF952 family)
VIVHLTTAAGWAEAVAIGRLEPPGLATEGFIHCSTFAQIEAVANRFYPAVTDAVLVILEETAVPELRWEPPVHPDGRGSEPDEPRFPHAYSPIPLRAVVQAVAWPQDEDGCFRLPPRSW